MMLLDNVKFNELAVKVYDTKIRVCQIPAEEYADAKRPANTTDEQWEAFVTAVKEYPARAWVEDQAHCPECDEPFLFSFRWGIVNGFGSCGNCGIQFQVYHRFGGLGLIAQYALDSLPKRAMKFLK